MHTVQELLRKILDDNTRVICKSNFRKYMVITEVLYIKQLHPTLNITLLNNGNGVMKVF